MPSIDSAAEVSEAVASSEDELEMILSRQHSRRALQKLLQKPRPLLQLQGRTVNCKALQNSMGKEQQTGVLPSCKVQWGKLDPLHQASESREMVPMRAISGEPPLLQGIIKQKMIQRLLSERLSFQSLLEDLLTRKKFQ